MPAKCKKRKLGRNRKVKKGNWIMNESLAIYYYLVLVFTNPDGSYIVSKHKSPVECRRQVELRNDKQSKCVLRSTTNKEKYYWMGE